MRLAFILGLMLAVGACASKGDEKQLVVSSAKQSLSKTALPKKRTPAQRVSPDYPPIEYMAKLEADMTKKISSDGIAPLKEEKNILLTLPADRLFDENSYNVKESASNLLKKISSSLAFFPKTTVQIKSYTDNGNRPATSKILSERRAQSIAATFSENKISPNRIHTEGMGSPLPVAPNETEEGKAQNNRIELILLPLTNE